MADAAVPCGSRLAVLGSPIAHSQSPALHAAAYAALGLDWSYERHEVDEAGLDAFLDDRSAGWRGLSLTMPLKARALRPRRRARQRSPTQTGAVNTLAFARRRHARTGFNTDVAGLVARDRRGRRAPRRGTSSSSAPEPRRPRPSSPRPTWVPSTCTSPCATPTRGHELDGLSASLGLTHAVEHLRRARRRRRPTSSSRTLPGGTVARGRDPAGPAARRPAVRRRLRPVAERAGA